MTYCSHNQNLDTIKKSEGTTYWNEQIRHQPLILLPALPILDLTPLNIPIRTMHNHASKEHRIKPGERTIKTSDQAPSQSKEQITRVMDLASISIPSISQKGVTRLGLDDAGVLNSLPWELG